MTLYFPRLWGRAACGVGWENIFFLSFHLLPSFRVISKETATCLSVRVMTRVLN